MRKALVLLSGGQDSTTCLYWAKKYYKEVFAVGFDYGQKHRIELEQAAKIAERIGITYKVFDVKHLLTDSSLTDRTSHNSTSTINPNLPASFTAGRNILFLTIAGSYAASVGATAIVIGVCQTDGNNYPDCRKGTIDAMQRVLLLGVGLDEVKIQTPLMFLTKAEIWKLGKELGCLEVILQDTITDYNGSMEENEWGYGQLDNAASQLRASGYYEAKDKGWI